MDLELFRSFTAVVEAGNLSGAAQRLHAAQPALTRQMKILQDTYGTPLIKTAKGHRHIELTDAGRILYHKARYILAMEDQLAQEIRAAGSGVKGILRLTTSPSVAYSLIAHRLTAFSEANPEVSFDLIETSTAEQAGNLLSGIAELGIANAPIISPEKFTIHLMVEDRMVLYINEKSPVLKDARLISREKNVISAPLTVIRKLLSELPICLTKGCRDEDIKFCSELGIAKAPLCVSTTVTAALQWAKENRAAVIAPINDAWDVPEGLAGFLLPASQISNFRILYSVKGRKLSHLALNFLEFVTKKSSF